MDTALTLKDCLEFVDYTLFQGDGGGNVPRLVGVGAVRQAGIYLMSHPWAWAQNAQVAVPLTEGARRVRLPYGFQELISAHIPGTITQRLVTITSANEIDHLRGVNTTFYPAGGYYVAARMVTDEDGAVEPWLEVWPDATTLVGMELEITYRRGWVNVTRDTDRIPIPAFMEPLFLQTLMHFARGLDEEDEATLEQRLPGKNSPLWRAALQADGRIQNTIGLLGRGYTAGHSLHGPDRVPFSLPGGPLDGA